MPLDNYEKAGEPLETIFEDVGEYIDASSHYIRRPRSESRPKTAKPNKARDADAYLQSLNRRRLEEAADAKVRKRIHEDLGKALEISQMSLWTGWSHESAV